MEQLDPLPSLMSPDGSTSFPPHLFPTPHPPSPLSSPSVCTPLHALKVTYGFPVLPAIPLPPFLCDVPARHIPCLTLTRPHPMTQADTSYQGEAGRWVQLIKYKSHVGNNWSTAPITAAEKARTLFPATVNQVHQQMMYSKVPTPHGGFASIFPCSTLHCCGKTPRDASDDGDSKTVSGVPHASLPTSGGTNPNTCHKFIGNAFSYKYYNTILWTSVDTRASMVMGCPNKCTVCNDCAQNIQQSPCTSPADADPKDVTVACACGTPILLLGLEGAMTQKGLSFTPIVLKVNSPTSIQRKVSRSKGNSVPPEVAFAIANFPYTDNAEMEVETFLEQRLPNVTCEARYNQDNSTMTLHFDTAANAAQGRAFLCTLSAVNLDLFSDICMEGQSGALELLDVIGVKRALTLSPPAPTLDSVSTPHYIEEVATGKKAKYEPEREDTPDMGSSSTAGLVHSNWNQFHVSRNHRLFPPPQSTNRLSSVISSQSSTRMLQYRAYPLFLSFPIVSRSH